MRETEILDGNSRQREWGPRGIGQTSYDARCAMRCDAPGCDVRFDTKVHLLLTSPLAGAVVIVVVVAAAAAATWVLPLLSSWNGTPQTGGTG
ncbi:hypothetical protein GGR51DRAFT_560236 [Nemania sp. FL0031]|nr:hypothetical protein GGR51DRAFT_560236 [Nemania sp. FL0031]